MKRVKILYFAAVRELVGHPEEDALVPDSVTKLSDFVAWLEAERAPIRGKLSGVRFAINETFADASDPVSDGDVVAVIPPVAGG